MFGIGGSEIIVILVVALLFLGPDKLPDAAKTISKGIRDLKKQSRALQQQIESDEQIGGAIRDLKSALRGEDLPIRPPVKKEPKPALKEVPEPAQAAALATPAADALPAGDGEAPDEPRLTLPDLAGEPDLDVANGQEEGGEDLAKLIKPAAGAVAKTAPAPAEPTEPKTHG